MHRTLNPHPDSQCDALNGIEVEIQRTQPCSLVARFTARGRLEGIVRPLLRHSSRADELWKSTCFEVFLRNTSENVYYEFNLSPSTQWAAYRFTGYRDGKSVPQEILPRIEQVHGDDFFEVTASLDLQAVADIPFDKDWLIGLSAVIEEASGRKSYWALRHPQGQPDFHHPDCFALRLPPP